MLLTFLLKMIQSHLLQLLCLIAMEPPNRLNDQSIRSEKVKVLESLKPLEKDNISSNFISAQYTNGKIDGVKKPGYIEEDGANQDSKTETFVAIKTEILASTSTTMLDDPTCNSAPTTIIPDIALVTAISGVCSAWLTFQIT